MIPSENLEDLGLRAPEANRQLVQEVMQQQPEQLDDHHRSRQAQIEKLIDSNEARKLACALRDLAWREYTNDLTSTDRKMLKKVRDKLLRELALYHEITVSVARQRLNQIINQAMRVHAAAV